MKNSLLALSVLAFLLSSCATQQSTVSYAEFAERYDALKEPPFERVVFAFHEQCCEVEGGCGTFQKGDCIVKKKRLLQAAEVISKQNDTVASLATSNNNRLSGLADCGYANAKKDEVIQMLENREYRSGIVNTGKDILKAGVCAALLFAK